MWLGISITYLTTTVALAKNILIPNVSATIRQPSSVATDRQTDTTNQDRQRPEKITEKRRDNKCQEFRTHTRCWPCACDRGWARISCRSACGSVGLLLNIPGYIIVSSVSQRLLPQPS